MSGMPGISLGCSRIMKTSDFHRYEGNRVYFQLSFSNLNVIHKNKTKKGKGDAELPGLLSSFIMEGNAIFQLEVGYTRMQQFS